MMNRQPPPDHKDFEAVRRSGVASFKKYLEARMTSIEELRHDQARVQIRESMRRVNEFYRKYPVGPCPKCGKPSRLAGAAGNGPCLRCTLGKDDEKRD